MSNSSYTLHFESQFTYGSCEHFFHFMWGYFLPAIHRISEEQDKDNTYIFRSCGPFMDEHIHAVMQANQIKYRIEAKDFTCDTSENIFLPRWDVCLLKPLWLIPSQSGFHAMNTIQAHFTTHPHLYEAYKTIDLAPAIAQAKAFILKGFNLNGTEALSSSQEMLVLQRSEEPEFYRMGSGGAAIAGYGTGRRSLKNTNEIAEKLNVAGIPSRVFEPGKYSLREQIIAYRQCNGVIGIRGAEFANLLWLPTGSKVILVDPMNIKNPPVQQYLSELLTLNYHQIDIDEGAHPVVDVNQLISTLKECE